MVKLQDKVGKEDAGKDSDEDEGSLNDVVIVLWGSGVVEEEDGHREGNCPLGELQDESDEGAGSVVLEFEILDLGGSEIKISGGNERLFLGKVRFRLGLR